MIRYLGQEEKRGTMALWRNAFPEDSESFLEYYYTEKTKDNKILVAEEAVMGEGQRIVSMLHRNPYELQVKTQVWTCDYIVAVATAPDRRHRGWMRALLTQALEDMHEAGMQFCYLMPVNPRIYEPFDFVYVFDQPHWKLKDGMPLCLDRYRSGSGDLAEIAAWMNGWLEHRYQVFAKRTERYVKRFFRELESEKGFLERIKMPPGRFVGLRCAWGNEKKEQRMLFCEEDLVEREREAAPAIMARIVHLKNFLKLIRLQKDSGHQVLRINLTVMDQICKNNQGNFLWIIDKNGSELHKLETKSSNGGDYSVSVRIGELTRQMFGYGEKADWTKELELLDRVYLDEVV